MIEETRLAVLEAVRRKLAAGSKKKRKAKKRNRAAPPIPAENGKTSLEKPTNSRDLTFPHVEDGPRVPGRPLWMPEGLDLEKLPVEIRQAVAEIVEPAYEQLVLRAAPGLEKSLGASLVHLLWLEIIDQFDIKREYTAFTLALELPYNRQQSIDNHLRLLDAKLRHGKFMLRLEELRRHLKSAPPSGEGVAPAGIRNSSAIVVPKAHEALESVSEISCGCTTIENLSRLTGIFPLDQVVEENGRE